MKKFLNVLCAFMLLPGPLPAQSDWQLAAGKGDIRVYSKASPDSRIKSLKAECKMNASVAEVRSLLLDIPATSRWMCHTKSCSLLRKISDKEVYYYTEVALPWPLDNRDFVTHATVETDAANGIVTVHAPAVGGEVAEKDGLVRVTKSKSTWRLVPLADGQTKVQYFLHVDPGGAIPVAVVNMFARRTPIEIFNNMKKELQLRKGLNSR